MDDKLKRFYNLGMMYLSKGETENAAKWLEKAAAGGHEEALTELEKMNGLTSAPPEPTQKKTEPVQRRPDPGSMAKQAAKEKMSDREKTIKTPVSRNLKETTAALTLKSRADQTDDELEEDSSPKKAKKSSLLAPAIISLVIVILAVGVWTLDPLKFREATNDDVIEDALPVEDDFAELEQIKLNFNSIIADGVAFSLPVNLAEAFGTVENFQVDPDSTSDGTLSNEYRYYLYKDMFKVGIHSDGTIDYLYTESGSVLFGDDGIAVGKSDESIYDILGEPDLQVDGELYSEVTWSEFMPFEVKAVINSDKTIAGIEITAKPEEIIDIIE